MVYRRPQGRYKGTGRMSDSRIAWAKIITGVFEVRQFLPQLPEDEDEDFDPDNEASIGPNVRLGITIPGMRNPLSLHLTACTAVELHALRTILNLAIDLAEPVVLHRDEVARIAKAEGDDSHPRVYRQLPELVVRHGKIWSYSEGVLSRPEDVPDGHGNGLGGHGGGVRGAGDGVADPAPANPGTEDDGAAPDQPA